MPLIHRVMRRDDGDLDVPRIANTAEGLGARLGRDIRPDPDGNVHPGAHGLSAIEDWRAMVRRMQPTLLPRSWREALIRSRISEREREKARAATGKGHLWRHGKGAWQEGSVTDHLTLRIDEADSSHGFIAPATPTSFEAYQAALAATQRDWVLVQPDGSVT